VTVNVNAASHVQENRLITALLCCSVPHDRISVCFSL